MSIKSKTMAKLLLIFVQLWTKLRNLLELSVWSCVIFAVVGDQKWTKVARITITLHFSSLSYLLWFPRMVGGVAQYPSGIVSVRRS